MTDWSCTGELPPRLHRPGAPERYAGRRPDRDVVRRLSPWHRPRPAPAIGRG